MGDSSDGAAFYSFTEDYAFFRERVVGDPLAVGANQGFLLNACWVVVFDFDSSNGYEYLLSLSGKEGEENEIGEPEEAVRLFENAIEGKQIPFLMDPTNTDIAEILREEFLLSEFHYYACEELDTDYWFVTWAIPMDALLRWMDEVGEAGDFDEMLASGDLTLHFGTSADHNNYNKDVLVCEEPASLTVCKEVINLDGGIATAHDWDIVILDEDGQEAARLTPESDDVNCVSFTLAGGAYEITEEGPDGYVASYSGDTTSGIVTLNPGDNKRVTLTNDDAPATITLHKTVINNDDGALTQDDFQAYLDGFRSTGMSRLRRRPVRISSARAP